MLPVIAAIAAAVAAGKLIYDAVTDDNSSNSSSSGTTQAELEQEREKQRATERVRLTNEALDDARRETQLLLEAHSQIVFGNVKTTLQLNDLRKVAAMAPNAEGLKTLEPLTIGLNYTSAHKTAARQIEQLKAEHAALQQLIRSL